MFWPESHTLGRSSCRKANGMGPTCLAPATPRCQRASLGAYGVLGGTRRRVSSSKLEAVLSGPVRLIVQGDKGGLAPGSGMTANGCNSAAVIPLRCCHL